VRDEAASLYAGAAGFIVIRHAHERQALIEACDWLIGYEQRSQRDGLLPEEVDRSLDQLSEARALQQRLRQLGHAVAVPLGIVPAIIDELAERVLEAARGGNGGRVLVDLSELLAQLERLPPAEA
jgi:hypothetical protein